MPVRIEANAEPIAGYRLIERLGGGGFGEVWKAEAPGGLHKAIKFVFGDLEAADTADGVRATQELKALSRVKTVHHPYILSLERYDIVDGQLMIVMELADRTLWDRFRECRNQGLPGIPRAELLQYMNETAEALDLMNNQFQLQHLDIKPQNLFLVFNHVKVADFGLVKDLGVMGAATVTGGVTPVYAAPETFDGWLSRFSDQYSLAIVYQEMLTGQRPFGGSTMRQLVMQHLQGVPDVSSLPATSRAAVQRALSKNPDDRFPTCLEFVRSLEPAVAPRPGNSGLPAARGDANAPLPPLTDTQHGDDWRRDVVDISQTRDSRGGRVRSEPAKDDADKFANRPQVLPPRPGTVRPDVAPPADLPPIVETHAQGSKILHVPGPAVESGCRGMVQPSLIVGLGKLGMQTLLALRRTLSHEFGHPDALPHVRLVGIDTDAETIQAAGKGDLHSILRPHELVLSRLRRPSHYLQMRDSNGNLPTDGWLNAKLLYRVPKQANSAGLRALGRLAFVDNHKQIAKRLQTELQACAAQDTMHDMVQQTDLGIRSQVPRVYVVAGLGGSTGGGMFLDAAFTLRRLLRQQGHARAEVVGLFILPPADKESLRSAELAQAYAALAELNHYSRSHTTFSASYDVCEPGPAAQLFHETGPPFDRCYFMTLPAVEKAGAAGTPAELSPTVALAGQFLYRDVATPVGKAADTARQQARREATQRQEIPRGPSYQTFGLYRVVWPRRSLLDQAARRWCRRLVEHWMNKDAASLVEPIAVWAQQQWDAAGLRPEDLIGRHQELCEKALSKAPDRMIQEVLNPLAKVLMPPAASKPDAPPPPINLTPVLGAMASLDKLLGMPDAHRDGNLAAAPPGVIEKALAEVASGVAEASDHQLTELIVRLLEEPEYRLAGAEEGLRQFGQVVEQALRSQETLTKELQERAGSLHVRIHELLASNPQQCVTLTQSSWKLGFARKPHAKSTNFGAELLEIIKVYAKTRYQCLVLAHINRLYVSLRGYLSDQVREVGFCRQRLTELAGFLDDKAIAAPPPLASFEKLLLPTGCATVADAVRRLDERLTQENLVAFDQVLQQIIRQQYRALVNVCMGPSNLVRNLAPVMIQEAETFLTPYFQGESVADMWMTGKDDSRESVAQELKDAYAAAVPASSRKSGQNELAIAALPTSPAGQQLKELAKETLARVQIVDSERGDELVFYREVQPFALNELPQFGGLAQEAYRQCCSSEPALLHSRSDVAAWQGFATS